MEFGMGNLPECSAKYIVFDSLLDLTADERKEKRRLHTDSYFEEIMRLFDENSLKSSNT